MMPTDEKKLFAQHWIKKPMLSLGKSPNGVEVTCWKLLASNSFTFLLEVHGHIFQHCHYFETQQLPQMSLLWAKGEGEAPFLCTFASSLSLLGLPAKMLVLRVAFSMWAPVPSTACGWMEVVVLEAKHCMWTVTFTVWVYTRLPQSECSPSCCWASGLLNEIEKIEKMNSPHL